MRSLFCFALLALAGCSFTRTVVNAHVRDIDTRWIEPGRTTRDDVLSRIGRPPATTGVKDANVPVGLLDGQARHYLECLTIRPRGIDAKDEDVDAVGDRAFHWFCADSYDGRFEGGKWIIPTFSTGHVRRAYDILILFDATGVVSLVGRTEVRDDKVCVLEWREAKP